MIQLSCHATARHNELRRKAKAKQKWNICNCHLNESILPIDWIVMTYERRTYLLFALLIHAAHAFRAPLASTPNGTKSINNSENRYRRRRQSGERACAQLSRAIVTCTKLSQSIWLWLSQWIDDIRSLPIDRPVSEIQQFVCMRHGTRTPYVCLDARRDGNTFETRNRRLQQRAETFNALRLQWCVATQSQSQKWYQLGWRGWGYFREMWIVSWSIYMIWCDLNLLQLNALSISLFSSF